MYKKNFFFFRFSHRVSRVNISCLRSYRFETQIWNIFQDFNFLLTFLRNLLLIYLFSSAMKMYGFFTRAKRNKEDKGYAKNGRVTQHLKVYDKCLPGCFLNQWKYKVVKYCCMYTWYNYSFLFELRLVSTLCQFRVFVDIKWFLQ